MKIGKPAEKPAPATVTNGPNARAQGAKPNPNHAADASAKIELSSAASGLLAAGSSPEFDAAKVQRISQSIEAGTFKANPEAIADKLIANAQEVLHRGKA
jgi:negative regulator of flagellin synthesis FlgM